MTAQEAVLITVHDNKRRKFPEKKVPQFDFFHFYWSVRLVWCQNMLISGLQLGFFPGPKWWRKTKMENLKLLCQHWGPKSQSRAPKRGRKITVCAPRRHVLHTMANI